MLREASVNFSAPRLNTLDMCCLKEVSELILKRWRLWLGDPCQRITLRSDFFGVGYLYEELCKEFYHDGFVERQI